jgi:hypothetical protein
MPQVTRPFTTRLDPQLHYDPVQDPWQIWYACTGLRLCRGRELYRPPSLRVAIDPIRGPVGRPGPPGCVDVVTAPQLGQIVSVLGVNFRELNSERPWDRLTLLTC